jgi:SAM-dependent methyltransferase
MPSYDAADYWENRLRGSVALDKVGYLGLGKHYNQWLYRVRERVFRKTIRSLGVNLADCSVMDIGSGTGFYVRLWKDHGAKHVAGLDITTAAVEHLKSRFPDVSFYKADITDAFLPLGKLHFDVISAFDVLFHIVDDVKYRNAIANIGSLLKPGGLFLFSDMFTHSEVAPSGHVWFRPLGLTKEVLHQCGFKVLRRSPIFVMMNEPTDSRSQFRKHLWGILQRIISKSEVAGLILGAGLYPAEVLLASTLKESCSTEIMICRKESTAFAST